jgi:hypothetical protein
MKNLKLKNKLVYNYDVVETVLWDDNYKVWTAYDENDLDSYIFTPTILVFETEKTTQYFKNTKENLQHCINLMWDEQGV